MEFPEARIIIFCKAPIAGQVKTRLIPALGEADATQIHEILATHCIKSTIAANLCQVDLWCSPTQDHQFFRGFNNSDLLRLHTQAGTDLGARMAHAFESTLCHSAYAIIIGADCPVLDRSYLYHALQSLRDGSEVVIGPAEDNGYVLLGLRKMVPELFQDMAWGSPQVLPETLGRLNKNHINYQLLKMLWDVDRPEDVERLRNGGKALNSDFEKLH
jgi:rSAM/selenodomain-associated transferase 1